MPPNLSLWRELINRHKPLLADLALILASTLIIGIFFLENLRSTIADERREGLEAITQQLAHHASEYMITTNLVSLNVIANHAATLPTISRVEFRDAADGILASAGDEQPSGPSAHRHIRLKDASIAGGVRTWQPETDKAAGRLEEYFVLIAFCLLMLRILASLIQRHLSKPTTTASQENENVEADILPVLTMSNSSSGASAWLRISFVNFERMQERLTPTLLTEILTEYRHTLNQVGAIYGATVSHPLGDQGALVFRSNSRSEACFQALCAGMLFRRLARELSDERKNRDRTPLEFKQLVTGMGNLETSWAICKAGQPGRIHVPEQELMALELDTRLLFQPERCLVITAGEHEVRIQPVEQLAQRYQRLVAEQAKRLSAMR